MMTRALPLLLLASACVTADPDERSAQLTGTTIVSLTFDDTLADGYQAGDLADARGFHVTFFVNSPRIGASGYMTLDQVTSLQQRGHEIGGHTLDHVDLTTLTESEMQHEICDDRDALLADGFAVTSFAYPFGADNTAVHDMTKYCGYNSARDVGGLVTPGSCSGCPYANTIPPQDYYQVRTNDSVKSTTTLSTLELYVTQAEQHGGGWVPIVFHHICDGCNTYSVSATTLSQFLDWLAPRSAQGTQVATVQDVIGGPVNPPVSGSQPPPPPPPPSGNLLQNPSLEIDANGDQVPDCWKRDGYGTNTATYSLVSTAADGNVAQRIDMTSYSSGAQRLMSAQDSGTCAPAATSGHTYTVQASYIATTPPIFTIYYRNTSGVWSWFAQSPKLPTSSSYVTAQYTTPAFPSDATAISIGLSITGVGYIISDAYSLVDDQGGTTSPPATDTTPPTISIACNGGTCSTGWYASAVTVSVTATDDSSGVKEIRYTTDGSDPVTSGTLYTGPFQVASTATVKVTAVDNAGNRAATQSVPISIDTVPPTAAVARPSDGASVTGTIQFWASVSDNVGVYSVGFYVDGVQIAERVQTSYKIKWDTSTTSKGQHQLSVQATDLAGNATMSPSITVTVR